jgi:hypothetical protein
MKTMKTTMKKQSPLKELLAVTGKTTTKGTTTSGRYVTKKKNTPETSIKTKAPATKPAPVEGKPNAATVKTPATKSTTKTPAMQMKKAGMKKKC